MGGGSGGLGPRPDYSAGAKYIDQAGTNGDGPPIDAFSPNRREVIPIRRGRIREYARYRTDSSDSERRIRVLLDAPRELDPPGLHATCSAIFGPDAL